MKWYHLSQNNSGGHFDVDPDRGIGANLFIQAENAQAANDRAEEIGCYWNGVDDGSDCSCCGDRWYPISEYNSSDEPEQYGKPVSPVPLEKATKYFGKPSFLHYADGTISAAFWTV